MGLNTIKTFKKGEIIVTEGQYLKESYFVVEGILRQFKNVNGDEVTSNFYTDGEAIFFVGSHTDPQPCLFSLECLEDTSLSVVSFKVEKEMYTRFPRFEKMCRIKTEENLLKFQADFANYISSSPEQRYLRLQDTRPELIDRVPQYHLASYIGVKPESLSRIRKRVARGG